jgi:hypothetical protein
MLLRKVLRRISIIFGLQGTGDHLERVLLGVD